MQNVIELDVYEVHQSSGGYEHVVIFKAHLLLSEGSDIELWHSPALVGFSETSNERLALKQIELGIRDVLAPKGLGAAVEITQLCLHRNDFIAETFRHYMAKHLTQELELLDEKAALCNTKTKHPTR